MFVCICKNITTKDIEEAAERHAFDSTLILQELGVGTDCGTCIQTAIDSLKQAAFKQKQTKKS